MTGKENLSVDFGVEKVKNVCGVKVITKRPNQRAVLEGLLFGLLPPAVFIYISVASSAPICIFCS